MARYFAKTALLPQGWASDVIITVDDSGWISAVETNAQQADALILSGPVLPGMPNLHSHAFQRAMAGLAERVTSARDSFWTWREIMYGFLVRLSPEDTGVIAAQLYVEMLKAGYTSVAEFHYVHHQPDGTPYEDRAEISNHVIGAALHAGIAVTHLPVLYAHSGFGGAAPGPGQKRFLNKPDEILEIISSIKTKYAGDPQVSVGLAHHSLRAVSPDMLREATAAFSSIDADGPVHIHVAEQVKEVEDCIAWSGKRPVEWLLGNMDVDSRWCLIHATHMTKDETLELATSGAVAGLCPTTEANLGDGFFNLPEYIAGGGKWGIGSDSHISVNMIEELRLLEYGQRLLHKGRSIARVDDGTASNGRTLYDAALGGGAQACGRRTGRIEAGCRADFIVLDPECPALAARQDDYILDSMIFAANTNPVRDVFCGGRHVVQDGAHHKQMQIETEYRKVLHKLLEGV